MKVSYFTNLFILRKSKDDSNATFGIIVKGRAIVYAPKEREDAIPNFTNQARIACYSAYRHFLEKSNFFGKLKQGSRVNQPILTRSNSLYTAKSIFKKQGSSTNNQSQKNVNLDPRSIIDVVLNSNNNIVNNTSLEDLSIEEKLLMPNNNPPYDKYFRNKTATFKKIRELKEEQTVADITLTTNIPLKHTIIAVEDVHLLTIKKEHFRTLFFQGTSVLREKKDFMWSLFTDLSIEAILKLCAYTEEKCITNCENVYQQGDESDAIYIVRSGEVQVKLNL